MKFLIEKYNLKINYFAIPDSEGAYVPHQNTIYICSGRTREETAKTVAHELGHFFYQYEINNHNERLEERFNTVDKTDLGGKISEMIAHIVGHYGEEIQKLTKFIMYKIQFYGKGE